MSSRKILKLNWTSESFDSLRIKKINKLSWYKINTFLRTYLISIDSRLAPQIKAQLARDCALLLLTTGNRTNYTKPVLQKKTVLKSKNFETDKKWVKALFNLKRRCKIRGFP